MGSMIWGSSPGRGKRFISSPKRPASPGAYPAYYSGSTGDPFPAVKWVKHDVAHSPPSSAKVKNVWSYASTPPICLQGLYRDSFAYNTVKLDWPELPVQWAQHCAGGTS
jgi:hypothetical protein